MPRDYKNHKRPEKSAPRSGMGFVAGLTFGLVIALGVFIYDRVQSRSSTAAVRTSEVRPAAPRPAAPKPAVNDSRRTEARASAARPDVARPDVARPEPARADSGRSEAPRPKDPPPDPVSNPQFDFYEMLPKFEVVIPEQDESTPVQARNAPLQKAGVYVLQAGSFRNADDAERVRATIALQGVQSKIQRVAIDRDTWHRVRIGPISDLKKLEDTREKLRQAQIDALVIRVGG